MTKVLLAVGFLISATSWTWQGYGFTAQAEASAHSPEIITLLPDNFRGWACVDFGVAGAPPLPREGNSLVVRPRKEEVVKTSDKAGPLFVLFNAFYEVGGQRRPLPKDIYERKEDTPPTNLGGGAVRHCGFFGTEDESDASPSAPGYVPIPQERNGVSPEERRALIKIYKATGGDHWIHRVGWLGPPGTECDWHGVRCLTTSYEPDKRMGVAWLELSENNLVGKVPVQFAQLPHLESLMLFGNHLSAMLPETMVERWRGGTLELNGEASLLTDVTQIDFDTNPSSLLCGHRRISLASDGLALLFEKECRNATPDDRTTFCEVKKGKVWGQAFAKLAWLFEANDFYALRNRYARSITEGTFETTRVIRSGKSFEVENYADAGPLNLWVIQRAIEGVAASIDWETTTTQPQCPKWDVLHPQFPN